MSLVLRKLCGLLLVVRTMKNAFASSVIILLSMVCWITRIEAQENNNQSHVVQLTSENFWSVVQNEPCVFVKFYAPWCSHCNKMAKDFEKAAEELVGKAVFAEVDSTQEKVCVYVFFCQQEC